MKAEFKFGRLQLIPENEPEKKFCQDLIHSLPIHPIINPIMISWYGDVKIDDKEQSGYVITYKDVATEVKP